VIEAARRVTGQPIPTTMLGPRPGDPASLVADSGRAYRELGWRPQYADLTAQLSHAWQWHCRAMAQSATGS
jgi:UDP-glucose 4-epimerase